MSHIEMGKVTGVRIDNFIDIMCSINARDYDISIFSTSFQKSNIGWPQQPPTEKVQKLKNYIS